MKNKKFKFNIVDLFVVLIIIVACLVTYHKFNLSPHADVISSNGKAEYTLYVKEVREYTANHFVAGDKIYDEESGKCVGEITSVTFEPSKNYVTKTDGTTVLSEIPQKFDVYINVTTDAVINNTGINAGGSKTLYYNQKSVYYTKRVQAEAQIVELNIAE